MNVNPRGAKLGDVVTLRPLTETLEFRDAADEKVRFLVAQMLAVLKPLLAAMAAHDGQEEIIALEEIRNLQDQLAEAKGKVDFIEEVLDSANEKRADLWGALPQDKPALIFAYRNDVSYVAAMSVCRDVALVKCTDLTIYQRVAGKITKVA